MDVMYLRDSRPPSAGDVLGLVVGLVLALALLASVVEGQDFAGPEARGCAVGTECARDSKRSGGPSASPSSAVVQAGPGPVEETGALLLARCWVGESGFRRPDDQAAIAHSVGNRWRAMRRSRPGLTYRSVLVQACHGLRSEGRSYVATLPWVKGIGDGLGDSVSLRGGGELGDSGPVRRGRLAGNGLRDCSGPGGCPGGVGAGAPRGWPPGASWTKHRPMWAGMLQRARDYFAGRLASPCNGRPQYWGGMRIARDRARIEASVASERCRVLDCGDTANTFLQCGGRS